MKIKTETYEIKITGVVQGVGFRPFIWRIANNLDIKGVVTNTTEGVLIKINVEEKQKLLKFLNIVKNKKPEPARIEKIKFRKIKPFFFKEFNIAKSLKTDEKFQLISPDIATCKKCMDDINNKDNSRRYQYPFTNCTNCGPRFTIIKDMPYDRAKTTMSSFKMCPNCKKEYNNPEDRRFHAQPNACRICGPSLELIDRSGSVLIKNDNVIQTAASLLKKGKIIGIKSLGGFQISCDATKDDIVMKLRERKKRPAKPFALMFKDIKMVKKYLFVSGMEQESLLSACAPIVLLRKKRLIKTTAEKHAATEQLSTNIKDKDDQKKSNMISYPVSFYNKYEGAFLPYTPLHHILFNNIDFPLVMTSGNISEEPIASDNNEALSKLSNICDFFIIHNREIESKYDDSVIKIFKNNEMVLRRARGYAPYPVKLNIDIKDKVILAVGAQEKNTFCILKKNYAILSQHIGELDTLDSYNFFSSTLKTYMDLFGIKRFDYVAYDKHPEYISTKFALSHFDKSKKKPVQHHKAHIAGVIAENQLISFNSGKNNNKFINYYPVLGFAWDGTGYGDDGNIWGSEIFLIDKNVKFFRIGHLIEKPLPGGEVTIKKPYRMSVVYLYKFWKDVESKNKKCFQDYLFETYPFYKSIIEPRELKIIISQIDKISGTPLTTSMGRFFDTVSSILDLTHIISYESEGAVKLEMIANDKIDTCYDIKFIDKGFEKVKNYRKSEIKIDEESVSIIIDDYYILQQIIKDIKNSVPVSEISSKFHNTLVKIILLVSKKIRNLFGTNRIALSGGVFQNNILLKKIFEVLEKNNFYVYTKFKVPVNDGGISLGQAYIAAKRLLDLPR